MINTFAITTVTKYSIKPWSDATTNFHLRGSEEMNGEQRRIKGNFGRTMMLAMELLRFAKKHFSGRRNIEKLRTQAHPALAVIELCLS